MLFTLCNIIALFYATEALSIPPEQIRSTLQDVPEDGLVDFVGLANLYGYKAVKHEIVTEDNYVLVLFNIPGDKRVVLLSHGIFDTSDGWAISGNHSLCFILASQGYDVWLVNYRGNRYSNKHLTLSTSNESYWDFSAQEYGYFDLAASIDYVLKSTERPQLSLVGFSEGTTSTFILLCTRPQYNKKINVFIAAAPITSLKNAEGPLKFLVDASPFINMILPDTVQEFAGYYTLAKAVMNMLCTQIAIGYDLCYRATIEPVIGINSDIRRDFFDTIIGHFPAGTSRKNLVHCGQFGIRGFTKFDYGYGKNLQMYLSFSPPEYDLSNVKIDTYLVSGEVDRVSTLKDVEILKDKLPNVKEWKIISNYNHLDHLWAWNAYIKEYPYILEKLALYNKV